MTDTDLNRLKNIAKFDSDNGVLARSILSLLETKDRLIKALADRVQAQSELLSKRAEKIAETRTETKQAIELIDDSVRDKNGNYIHPPLPRTFVPGTQVTDVDYQSPPAGATGPGGLQLPGTLDSPRWQGEKAQ